MKSNKQQELIQLVEIQTPFQRSQIRQVTYHDVELSIRKNIQKMQKSGIYKQINVYFGVQSDTITNPHIIRKKIQQQEYQTKIQQLKKQILLIQNAKTLQQLDSISVLKKQGTKQNQYGQQFYPKILIKGVKKNPFYLSFLQEIDRNGMGTFKGKLGYRGFFYVLDRLEFNYQKLISRKNNTYNSFIRWSCPYQQNSELSSEFRYSNQKLGKNLYEQVKSAGFNYGNQNFKIDLELASRIPKIQNKLTHNSEYQYIKQNYFEPSQKRSIKVWKLLYNNLQGGAITTGKYADCSTEITIPYISQAQFVKFTLNFKNYFDLFPLSKYFEHKYPKKLFQNSSLEFNFGVNSLFKKTNFVSDYLQQVTVRGFQSEDTPNPHQLNFKTSLKWNIYNYPVLKNGNVRAFLYNQNCFNYKKLADLKKMQKPSILGSVGFGFSFQLNQIANLQLIYNIAQYQSGTNYKPSNFQIRFGID